VCITPVAVCSSLNDLPDQLVPEPRHTIASSKRLDHVD
jgi:hypothetical protein